MGSQTHLKSPGFELGDRPRQIRRRHPPRRTHKEDRIPRLQPPKLQQGPSQWQIYRLFWGLGDRRAPPEFCPNAYPQTGPEPPKRPLEQPPPRPQWIKISHNRPKPSHF
ncbi:MAG: hypothetical protein Fur0042_22410 [Cyanophyceae cyanobacterium]